MLVVRYVFRAKYGMGDALVKLFVEEREMILKAENMRVLTDRSGRFFTVVVEFTYENLAAYEEEEKAEFALPEFGEWFAKMMPLVESGEREFWAVQHNS